ncbi:pep-cterm sorting domain-containing protein [Anaeramoeba ignava]|uniref:Pep-cterm sorting domain-containing protein n=1 Tax=Anaeramoeba ignava TaxID=1746090 RepID=A0A9Q0RCK0_ANAIG|nr:pep-cterm sorting domain-containing protein [Anaeramoeba ignava]
MTQTFSNIEKLSEDFQKLFESEENYSDFQIICESKEKEEETRIFKCHKSILSARSDYFKSLFRSRMKEYQKGEMVLQETSGKILLNILLYFYTGKIEITLENAVEILLFSSKYLIEELTSLSSKFVMENCQLETVVDLLKISESINVHDLSRFCYQFILDHFEDFIKTPFFEELEENHLIQILSYDEIKTNEFDIFQAVVNWGKRKSNIYPSQSMSEKQLKYLKQGLSNLISKIRFIDFSKEEFNLAWKTDLIPKQISRNIFQYQMISSLNVDQGNQFIHKYQKARENRKSLIFSSRLRFQSSIIQEKEHIHKLREWIVDKEFFLQMKLGFSAKKNGWQAKDFHNLTDNKGKTLVIIKTIDNFIFGGYTSVGWTTNPDRLSVKNPFNQAAGWISDPHAFLFSLKNPAQKPPQKFPIRKNEQEYAIYYDDSESGPWFGRDCGLKKDLHEGFSTFGFKYSLPEGMTANSLESTNFLAGNQYWKVEEVESYFLPFQKN